MDHNPQLNLLVVDWDFFFPNPNLTPEPSRDDVIHYMWDHCETPVHRAFETQIWAGRAAQFHRSGRKLPRAAGYENFWDRFTWSVAPRVCYADSNLHAGRLTPATFGWDESAWHTVSLWDAHHDCGYPGTGSYEEWQAKGVLTCEDWMLSHHKRGSNLEVTYPAWRKRVGTIEPEPLVPVTRRVDDGTNPDRIYHAVFVCRSGAWVPPWCDDQFTAFLDRCPGLRPTALEDGWHHPRPDIRPVVEQEMAARAQLDDLTAARQGFSQHLGSDRVLDPAEMHTQLEQAARARKPKTT